MSPDDQKAARCKLLDGKMDDPVPPYGPYIIGVLRNRLEGYHLDDIKNCLQNVAKKYQESSIRDPSKTKIWLAKVAISVARKYRGQESRQPKATDIDCCPEPAGDLNAARKHDRTEDLKDQLPQALETILNKKERYAVIRVYFEGASCVEVARVSGEGSNTVQRRVSRALAKLRKHLISVLDD